MSITNWIGRSIRNILYNSERDRLQEKFDHLDTRLDVLERNDAVKLEQIKANQEITHANLEALEQKINASTSAMQALDMIVKHHLSFMDDALKDIQQSLKEFRCSKR